MTNTIIIQKGDTLSALARKHNTTVAELARANGIANPDLIFAGASLVVPGAKPVPALMNMSPAQVLAPKVPQAAPAAVHAGTAAAATKSSQPPGHVVAECPYRKQAQAKNKLPIKRVAGDDNIDALFIEGDASAERKGLLGHGSAEIGVGMLRMEHAGNFGDSWFGGSHSLEAFRAGAKVEGGVVSGIGGQASAEAFMSKESASIFAGKDPNNPWLELGGGYSLMSAEAEAGANVGNSGKFRGYALNAGAEAAAAKGDVTGEINIPIPFTDWTISGRGKVGGNAGGVGGSANVHAGQDLETGRYHAGAGGAFSFLLGGKLDFDLSIGPAYNSRERPLGP